MYSIDKEHTNEIIIKNSKFICVIYKLNNIEDIKIYLDNIKNEYKDANHYCYAYIYEDIKKSSDDKEPSSTAGIPMLQVLEKNNLNYILAITIRYFGGIKLGKGGLTRAYTKSITEVLKKANIKELIKGYNITIEFNYESQNQIDYILKDSNILKKEYNEKITYEVQVTKEKIEELKLLNIQNIKINKEIYI